MWNGDKQERLDLLRHREAQGKLTKAERTEMEALFAELDAEEAQALRPALVRSQQRQAELRNETEQLAREVQQLERILQEHEQLLRDARSYLTDLRARRAVLADEYRRVTGHELTAAP
jgi:hypothetical protein